MGKVLIHLLLLTMAGSFLFTACDSEGCVDGQVSFAIGSCSQLPFDSLKLSTVSVYGTGMWSDSVMKTSVSGSSALEIRLDPASEVTKLRFDFALKQPTDTIRDTVTFYYENHDYFVSIDCGCVVFHYIDSIGHTNNFIKKIAITNPEITNEKTPNFTIYY